MALISATIASSIEASSTYSSSVLSSLAWAIGNSITSWISIPTNVLVRGTTSGLVGAGSVSGTLTFKVTNQILTSFSSASIVGNTAPGLASAIQNGLSSSLNSAQYVGASAAVGTGTDVSTVVLSNSSTLLLLLLGNLQGASINGQSSFSLASALASGISSIILTGTGFGSVTGAAGNVPTAGTSISTIF